LATRAHIADHVPVDERLVHAAALAIALPDGHVHGPADLLVKQDRAGELLNIAVGANRELAQAARAGIGVERADQELLVGLRLGVDHQPVLEAQFHTLHLIALIVSRIGEAHPSIDAILDRAGENFAIRYVVASTVVEEHAPVARHFEIDVLALDLQVLLALLPLDLPLLGAIDLFLQRDLIVLIDLAGAEQEVSVLP